MVERLLLYSRSTTSRALAETLGIETGDYLRSLWFNFFFLIKQHLLTVKVSRSYYGNMR